LQRRTIFSLIVLLVLLLTLSPVRPAAAQPPGEDALIARIDALAARSLAAPGAAGLSVAVARADTIILNKGYGKADLEHDVPTTSASPFRIASVTKQFTAAAILHLAEQGKLALDDNITRYVDYPTHGKAVTIRHLLTHTSGIKSYTDVPGFFDTVARDLPPEKVLDAVRELPPDFEPGTKWEYSNTGYHLLGMIIEKVSGVPFATYMQDEFFTPLKLTNTRYDVTSDLIPGRARGYGVIDSKPVNASYISMTIPYSSGGLLSTAGDLIRWELALMGGKVISPESYRQMTTPTKLPDGSATRYGFGLFLSDVDGHPNFMHEGGIPGFNSILVYFPNEKLSIAVLSNSPAASAGLLAAQIAREAFATKESR
jgi:CubicO group peptidase (beta-lactamase class C family)